MKWPRLRWPKVAVDDALVLVGVLLVGYGVWLLFEPAAYIVVGVACLALGLLVRR